MTWDAVQEVIEEENARLTFIASCFGGKATQDLNNAYGFAEDVDYRVATYVILDLLFNSLGESSVGDTYYNLALNRFFFVLSNPESGGYLKIIGGGGGGGGSSPDYVFWHFGVQELAFDAISIALALLGFMLNLEPSYASHIPFTIKTQIVAMFTITASLALFQLVATIAGHDVGDISLLGAVASCVSIFVPMAILIINTFAWWKIASSLTMLAAQTVPAAWLIKIAFAVNALVLIFAVVAAICDGDDTDILVNTPWG